MPFTKVFGLPAKRQDGFPKGLAGDGARIQTAPPDHPPFFDHGHALAQLRRLYRGPLACRSASNTHEIGLDHVTYCFWHVRLVPLDPSMVVQGIRMLRTVAHNFDNIPQGIMGPLKNGLIASFCF